MNADVKFIARGVIAQSILGGLVLWLLWGYFDSISVESHVKILGALSAALLVANLMLTNSVQRLTTIPNLKHLTPKVREWAEFKVLRIIRSIQTVWYFVLALTLLGGTFTVILAATASPYFAFAAYCCVGIALFNGIRLAQSFFFASTLSVKAASAERRFSEKQAAISKPASEDRSEDEKKYLEKCNRVQV